MKRPQPPFCRPAVALAAALVAGITQAASFDLETRRALENLATLAVNQPNR